MIQIQEQRLLWPTRRCLGCGGTKEHGLCPECGGRGAFYGRTAVTGFLWQAICEACEGAGKRWRCRGCGRE